MKEFNENDIFDSKKLEGVVGKYKEQNLIARTLVDSFYRTIQEIIRLMGPIDPILEAGCGAGISSLRIVRMLHGGHFEISDINEDVMRLFENIGFPIPFQQESVLDLKRKDGTFDCVFLLEVLEHVADYRKALSELFRVSRKYVVVSVPNEPLWRILNMLRGKYLKDFGNTPGHINHWSTLSFTDLISEYGTIVKVYQPLPWTVIVARISAKQE